ncbi:hypothetical protein HMPREF9999_01504 [Alloprevotella sp. oral taxon 473 str. F0040]|nr:hypothetical protein HMPREF9999_01504 [Alloprevotella sp. oral taxon 473 str. F0040]
MCSLEAKSWRKPRERALKLMMHYCDLLNKVEITASHLIKVRRIAFP